MAITSTGSPSSQNLAYRPIVYTFDSDDATVQYCIVEVLIDDVRVSASSVQPDLNTTDEFTFDASDICKDNLDFTLNTLGSNGVISNTTGVKELKIKVYEVLLNAVTGLLDTEYLPSDDSNTNYDYISTVVLVYNWFEDQLGYNGFSFSDYQLNGTTKKFLTDSPSIKDIELLSDEFIGLLWKSSDTGKNYKLEVLTYNSANALLNTDLIAITEWDTAYGLIPNNTYIDIPVGTANLIAEGISLTNVAYYTIQVINDDGDKSEVKRFNIVDSCTPDTRIHWVNKYGKQDSYTFKGNVIESKEYDSKTFQKAKGITYSSESRGITSIQNVYNSNFTVYSKSIGRETRNFLLGLVDNNNAWVEIDDSYYPIIIDNGTKLVRDEMGMPFQFVLSYSFANPSKGLKG